MNADEDEGAYQLSHLYDQMIQRMSSDDDITKTRYNYNSLRKHPDRM